MTLKQIDFTLSRGFVDHKYTMFYDADIMTEAEALLEAEFGDCGCHNVKFLGHFLILPEYKLEFLKALVKDQKRKSYDEGFENGQNNLLEAGYCLPN